MKELNSLNVKSTVDAFLEGELSSGHYIFKDIINVNVNSIGSSESVKSNTGAINIKSPSLMRLKVSCDTDSRLSLFSYNRNSYSFQDIIPSFLEYFGRVFIIGTAPQVDEYYNLLFSNTNQDFNEINMILPVSSNIEGTQIFSCALSKNLCSQNIERFISLGFSEQEFDNRLDEMVESLAEKFK